LDISAQRLCWRHSRPSSTRKQKVCKPVGALRCSSCSTEWTHKRVSCPGCGCEEPDDLVVLRDPGRVHERADACRRCKTFVLCLDAGELAEVPDPDVAVLTMLPLEIQARREGYAPLAEHPWSSLWEKPQGLRLQAVDAGALLCHLRHSKCVNTTRPQ
jgi:formate dehydrogenase maturation protein FdhE